MLYWHSSVTTVEFPAASGIFYNSRTTSPILPSGSTVSFQDTPASFRVPTLLGGTGSSSENGFFSSQPNGNGGTSGPGQLPRGMWLGETYRPERIYTSGSPNQTAPLTRFVQFRLSNDSRLELQFDDGAGNWRTYQRYDRVGMGTTSAYRGRDYGFADNPYQLQSQGNPVLPPNGFPAYQALDISQLAVSSADPRSQRFGLLAMYLDSGAPSMIPTGDWKAFMKQGWSPTTAGTAFHSVFGPSHSRFSPSWGGGGSSNPWTNRSSQSPITNPTTFWANNPETGGTAFAKDRDEVRRRADGDSGNGVRPMQLAGATAANTQDLGIVINRPFRSVGELGYVFRDNPWKSLDFFSKNSADGALLDIFSVFDEPSIAAGKINLNTRNAVVLQSMLLAASREEFGSNAISATQATELANALVSNTTDTSGQPDTGPLANPAELAGRLEKILPVSNNANASIKTRREVIIRALAGSTQTRTWNLLVDVIAQSGRFSATATNSEKFIVEGEKRYWLHLAIDRITGQIVDQQFEPVLE
jgi:hypothetical protein